ncbi:PREDICTED: scarecrow-like protein 11 [Camelina sativa]|uniref:Scarecrow-like protein 11 n=1 Tax=Camelina sativa TaxID=90675 RepID=A0ABM0UNE2_CAMSA|nr:PREDICTED: scarecrow-like protein 11 [Camelina sativa]
MDALLQVSVDGFRFENGSGSCCKPRNNNLESGTNLFPSFHEPQTQSSSPNDSPPSVCLDNSPVLKYINDMLMDEEDFVGESRDNLALQAAERSFYEILQQQSPESDHTTSSSSDQNSGDDPFFTSISTTTTSADSAALVSNGESQRKYRHRDDEEDDLETNRRNKQPAIFVSEMEELAVKFEHVLLVCKANQEEDESSITKQQSQQPNRAGRAKGSSNRSKTQKPNSVDLRSLLTQCAQAVASFDQRRAAEKLKEIRSHSSSSGDGTQRLAFYFADALEARITGNIAPPVSTPFPSSTTSMVDILKAYKLFVHTCPIYVTDYFAANKSIYELALKATTLHIVDFGVLYGFQWPCLLLALSKRPGGPPKLRVTGIELPQSGFRPSDRVEETGRRLKRFCDKFNVPFEFNFIAKKWESISLDEIVINPGETTVVNCIHRLQYTPDETVSLDSPRDTVLKLFRDINPDLFVFAEINGMYNSPFFMTRFREALFHFSSLFDMFDTTIQAEDEYKNRALLEKELLVRDAMSVISCEGAERFARPETYKQWRVRILRAGFKPATISKQIMKEAKEIVRKRYHRDFVIDSDNNWMLQGWKGRVIYAFSCWKPAEKLTYNHVSI